MSATMKTGLSLLFGVCVLLLVGTEALNCYMCMYLDTEVEFEGLVIEESCGFGKVPEPDLSLDCSTLDYVIPSEIAGTAIGGIPNRFGIRENSSTRTKPPHPNAVFSCGMYIFNGNFDNISFDGQAVKGIFRGCLISYDNKTIDPQCHEGKLNNLIENVKQEEILDVLVDFSEGIDANGTDAIFCACNQDNCNTNSTRVGMTSMYLSVYI